MSSILTNTGSMVALQTLKMTNKNLGMVQNEISTGLRVASAKDNASAWAITATMKSDVGGYKQLNDSLATGSASVGVARTAAETVTNLLTQMKEKIVAAQSPSAERAKLQADVAELRNQIVSVVSAAQFNGLNLVNGTNASISVLASLDRDATGVVSTSSITVNGADLSSAAGAVRAGLTGSLGVTTAADDASFFLDGGTAATGTDILVFDDTNLAAGDKIAISIGDKTASYTLTQADIDSTTTADVVAVKMKAAIEGLGVAGLTVDYDSGTAGTLSFGNDGTGAVDQIVKAKVTSVGTGALAALAGIDVSTGAAAALADIEGLLNTSINAAAALGSSQKRIEIQQDFIGKLIDATNTGIGAMIDADMEEASARLTALQTQQQLGIQSLSIANQAPQSILSLFR